MFTVGETYEVYAPVAKALKKQLGITFYDTEGYSFKLTAITGGMLWTKQITYPATISGKVMPPASDGSYPLPVQIVEFIRPVTND